MPHRPRGGVSIVCCDLPRVLRVPGTMNYKNPEEPRLATFEVLEPIRRYTSLGDLDQHLPHIEKCPTIDEVLRGDTPPPRGRREVPQQIEAQNTSCPPSGRTGTLALYSN